MAAAPLYAILDAAARPELSCEGMAEALLRAGVKVFQYRQKGKFQRRHFDECVLLARRIQEWGGVFLVNDRADVAALAGADGVHLGQEDLKPEEARRFLGEDRIIGYSTHNWQQARQADALPVDYLAIGPVFPTTTKENPDPVVGLETVTAVRSLTPKPLVAIGGITKENAPAVLSAGADAVAVIRDLLTAPDIEERAHQFLKVLTTRSQKSEPRA